MKRIIDWHSHILPSVDDGSRNVSESIEMLKRMSLQGIGKVIATPHFFANDESVDSFCERREKSFRKLMAEIQNIEFEKSEKREAEKNKSEKNNSNENINAFSENIMLPEIILGAEVKYYNGISRLSDLKKLSFQGRNLLMVEMTMSRWTEYTVKEIVELAQNYRMRIIIAHIERYASFQSVETMERLYESGILMQVNSSFFKSFLKRHKALGMLEQGEIHMIGSDCHNLTSRPPNLKEAFDYIEKKLGREFVEQFNEFGERVISKLNNVNN